VTRSKLRPLGGITCPAPRVFAVLREPRKRRRFDHASQIPGLDDLPEAGALSLAEELLELGLLARDHGRYRGNRRIRKKSYAKRLCCKNREA